jgi:hypothetical protein
MYVNCQQGVGNRELVLLGLVIERDVRTMLRISYCRSLSFPLPASRFPPPDSRFPLSSFSHPLIHFPPPSTAHVDLFYSIPTPNYQLTRHFNHPCKQPPIAYNLQRTENAN